jgi:UDP-MurNAc hydroxylase
MKIIFYGHACLKMVDTCGHSVLMDPWFSRGGAFFQSWFQFPDNASLLGEALAGVNDICISHNHQDHFDPDVLRSGLDANPRLNIHIPKYETGWFHRHISACLSGFEDRIHEHCAYEPFAAGQEMSLFFVPEESPSAIDSAIIGICGGQSLVNLNDSRLSSDQLLRIREMVGDSIYLTLQASGASEYPVNYTYAADEREKRSLLKRHDKIDHCKKIIDLFEPDRVLFFAGPPVFLEKSLAHLNIRHPASIFPDQLDVVREVSVARPDIANRTLFLVPGDEFCDQYLWEETDLEAERLLPYTQKELYISAYRERRADAVNFDWGALPDEARLVRHFLNMVRISPYISTQIGGAITFVARAANGEELVYSVDFLNCRVRRGAALNPLYVLTAPASSVQAVLDGTHTWDDVFLSFRMTFDERTNAFVAHFKSLLRYLDAEILSKLETYERRLRGEFEAEVPMIDVVHEGSTFRIQRQCPHAGADLEYNGRVNPDGTITCLAHRFCFDLHTGDCTNAAFYKIKTEAIGGPIHSAKGNVEVEVDSFALVFESATTQLNAG